MNGALSLRSQAHSELILLCAMLCPKYLGKEGSSLSYGFEQLGIFSGPGFLLFEKVTLGTHLLLVTSSNTPGPVMFIISHH